MVPVIVISRSSGSRRPWRRYRQPAERRTCPGQDRSRDWEARRLEQCNFYTIESVESLRCRKVATKYDESSKFTVGARYFVSSTLSRVIGAAGSKHGWNFDLLVKKDIIRGQTILSNHVHYLRESRNNLARNRVINYQFQKRQFPASVSQSDV